MSDNLNEASIQNALYIITYVIRYYVFSKCECLTEHSTQFCKFYPRNCAINKAQSTYLKMSNVFVALSESALKSHN